MKTKIGFLIFILTCIFIIPVNAQTKSRQNAKDQKAFKITERMQKSLKLNSIQVPKVQQINMKYLKLHKEAEKSLHNKATVLRERIKQLNVERDNELKTVLTPEQYAKYQSLKRDLEEKYTLNKINRILESEQDSIGYKEFYVHDL